MPSGVILASWKRFRISRKIINAIAGRIRFDGGVKRFRACSRDSLKCFIVKQVYGSRFNDATILAATWLRLPACIGGGFDALMKAANQTGAGL
jgi:hypothetical protein